MQVPGDADLHAAAARLGERLRAARHRLVTAESCTGGWIAKAVTDVPGSSDWFDCGMAAYSYEAKQAMLGVNPLTLEVHGAVSRECVVEMVSGALVHSGATLAVAVTGIAGPGAARPTSRWEPSGSHGSAGAAIRGRRSSTSMAIATRCAARPSPRPSTGWSRAPPPSVPRGS